MMRNAANSDDDLNSHGSFDFMMCFDDTAFSDRTLIIEVLPDDAAQSTDPNVVGNDNPSCSKEPCLRVMKFNVCSLLLAARSPFFRKLFTNGMMESEQRCVTLRIRASEESAAMELLHFMYSGTLRVKTAHAVLDVLRLADKFQVVPCMRLCASLLAKLPMTTEYVLLYLELSSSHHLADAAKQYVTTRYKDIHEAWDEIMKLPLAGIEAILASDVLGVASEDALFDLALEWAEAHYPKPADRNEILAAHLCRYIRFPYMSVKKLREVLSCNIFDDGFAHKVIVDALFFKTTAPSHHSIANSNYHHRPYVRRTYLQRPVKVVELERPCKSIIVYFDLAFGGGRADAYLCRRVCSEPFDLGAYNPFYFYARALDHERTSPHFVVYLKSDVLTYEPLAVDFEFSAWSKKANKFVSKGNGSRIFRAGHDVILYEASWDDVFRGCSLDVIDDVVYFEVKLRLSHNEEEEDDYYSM